jgi:hypothetical protein
MFEQEKIDGIRRSDVGHKKRFNKNRQDSEALRGGVKKARPEAAGSADRSPPKPCWVCGRTHGGTTCSWFKHPLKGDKGVVWAMSINGKKAIAQNAHCALLRVFSVFGCLWVPALALYWLAGVVTGVMGLDP